MTESSVPIDAIPFEDVVSQGAGTLDYQLRNLAHDHTLILVNGKRRRLHHRWGRKGGSELGTGR